MSVSWEGGHPPGPNEGVHAHTHRHAINVGSVNEENGGSKCPHPVIAAVKHGKAHGARCLSCPLD